MIQKFNPETEQKRMMYINSLLNETLPGGMLTDDLLEELCAGDDDTFGLIHILFGNALKDVIESKDSLNVADWKADFHNLLLEMLDTDAITTGCVLNLAPYTRTIVYSCHKSEDKDIGSHLKTWFIQANDWLQAEERAIMMAFTNPRRVPFKDIGKLYKELRQLQNYQYTIGMGTMTFYDSFHFTEEYSVAEYKYIQRYEKCLIDHNLGQLKPLTLELIAHLVNHRTKDSKVIYICKELMSVTIRHLYSEETEHLSLIEDLNLSINNFDNRFNDLRDFGHYFTNILTALSSKEGANPNLHPHIRKVLAFIDRDYANDLTLDQIADDLNLTNAYLSRLFKAEVGITFKQYLTKYRLDFIKDQLSTTSLTVQEIASNSGYQSANQLTRIFKKYEQITPRDYRHSPSRS